jgi:hypothetical protein
MKKRVAKRRASKVSRLFWQNFRRSRTQGNYLTAKQIERYERAVYDLYSEG